MKQPAKAVRIHADDSVAVALEPLSEGETILGVTLVDNIPGGHKFALTDIQEGSPVIKYGCPIGKATALIKAGSHVHVHNVKTLLSENAEYTYAPDKASLDAWQKKAEAAEKTIPQINAYKRADGRIGIRNEIWIVPTVGCVNKTAELLAARANRELSSKYPGIDGFHAWLHPYGCSQMGTDHEKTRTILADLARHPNAGGVLVLGLGCENNRVSSFMELVRGASGCATGANPTVCGATGSGAGNCATGAQAELPTPAPSTQNIDFLETQSVEDETAVGMKKLEKLAQIASQYKREKVPASKLVIGMKCGGSDGLSGITANALVGQVCDLFTAAGSSVILTEVPEMFGAEQLLMNRCVNESVYKDTVNLINNFKDYFTRHGQVVYENPSPGNKDGGITTLEDKSLGCVQKGGKAPVCGVLSYGDRISRDTHTNANVAQAPESAASSAKGSQTPESSQAQEKLDDSAKGGVYLLEGPGNDIVSTTAMTAAGANLILFTTGRGTPLGAPVPTIKIATNHPLATRKKNWIDFDASAILLQESQFETRDSLTSLILQTADGDYRTKNEQNGYREIAIMKEGVTL